MGKQMISAPQEQLYAVYIQSSDRIYHINKDCAGEGYITINNKIAKCQARKPCERCSNGHQVYEPPVIETIDTPPIQEQATESLEQASSTPLPVADIPSIPEPLIQQEVVQAVEQSAPTPLTISGLMPEPESIISQTTGQAEPMPLSMTDITSTPVPLKQQTPEQDLPLSMTNISSTPEPLADNFISQTTLATEPIKAQFQEQNSFTEITPDISTPPESQIQTKTQKYN